MTAIPAACRRFTGDAYRLGRSRAILGRLTDSLFMPPARVADAAAQGYAREQGQLATERGRRRDRLRDLLIIEPPPGQEAIAELTGGRFAEPEGRLDLMLMLNRLVRTSRAGRTA